MEFWKSIESYVINLIPLLIGIALILTYRRRKRARKAWQNFARMHGLFYRAPESAGFFSKKAAIALQDPGEVHGRTDGLPFRLHVAIYGTSKDRRIFTIMSVEIPGLPAGLKIYHENVFLKFTKLLGAQDVTTGDSDFDAAFVVKGNDPAKVMNWLDARRRRAILLHIGEESDIDIRRGCLQFQRGQIVDDEAILENSYQKLKMLIPSLKPS